MSGLYVLVVGAGRGRRFGGDLPKQYCDLAGAPLLRHTLKAFTDHPGVIGVRPVIHLDDLDLFQDASQGLDVLEPVSGGASRQDSVRLGLESIKALNPDSVFIHDAARPFISSDLIDRIIDGLKNHQGIIPALPVVDTLKRQQDGHIADTVDRTDLWRAQTPQAFDFKSIFEAHQQCKGQELTDDAAVAEQCGVRVSIVEGAEENFKVTTQEDLARANRQLLGVDIRTGMGFDVHRFEEGDHVTLAGIEIPYHQKLKGHSDADVALHALTDAILGTIAAGDIGTHFPPSDNQWKGAASDIFLKKAGELVRAAGGTITNLDLTIICEAPKIGPHRPAMESRIADILGLDQSRVSVKATTTEKLGFTGRGEGIAAQAIATVCLNR